MLLVTFTNMHIYWVVTQWMEWQFGFDLLLEIEEVLVKLSISSHYTNKWRVLFASVKCGLSFAGELHLV